MPERWLSDPLPVLTEAPRRRIRWGRIAMGGFYFFTGWGFAFFLVGQWGVAFALLAVAGGLRASAWLEGR